MAFIYVMTIGADLIKIGYSKDPDRRRHDLVKQTGKPVAIYAAFDCGTLNHRKIERDIHRALRDFSVYREVFSMAPADALPHLAVAFGLSEQALSLRRWAGDTPKPKPRRSEAETGEAGIDARICRAARAGNGWSIADLAKLAGVSKNTISGFETGQKQPNKSSILAIQRAIDAGRIRWYRDENRIGLRWDDEPGGPPLLLSDLPT